jgi:hypothetical protein
MPEPVKDIIKEAKELICKIEKWMDGEGLQIDELERAGELLQEYRDLMKRLREAPTEVGNVEFGHA